MVVGDGMRQITVYSLDGKLLKTIEINGSKCAIKGLSSGVYLLKIEAADGCIVKKTVKI